MISSARRNACFGARFAVRRRLDVLADHAVTAAEARPRRREPRIQLEAALGTDRAPRRGRRRCAPSRWRAGRARRRVRRAARRARRRRVRRPAAARAPPRRAARCRPAAGTDRRATTERCATSAAFRSAPRPAARRRAADRPERSSVPITTRSTSASAASALRSGASPAKRAAVALERTISDRDPTARSRSRPAG